MGTGTKVVETASIAKVCYEMTQEKSFQFFLIVDNDCIGSIIGSELHSLGKQKNDVMATLVWADLWCSLMPEDLVEPALKFTWFKTLNLSVGVLSDLMKN